MTTEMFLGGLAILTLAAVIIVALTNGKRGVQNQSRNVYNDMREREAQTRGKRPQK